jgi:hypothetical protein
MSTTIMALPHLAIAAALSGEDAITDIAAGNIVSARNNARRAASYAFAFVPRDYGEQRFLDCQTLAY